MLFIHHGSMTESVISKLTSGDRESSCKQLISVYAGLHVMYSILLSKSKHAALVEQHQPDFIGLQEIKVHDDEFPHDEVQPLGYHTYHFGQKGHYGVAILSKEPASKISTATHKVRIRNMSLSIYDNRSLTQNTSYTPGTSIVS